jgi:hypothetical protein
MNDSAQYGTAVLLAIIQQHRSATPRSKLKKKKKRNLGNQTLRLHVVRQHQVAACVMPA